MRLVHRKIHARGFTIVELVIVISVIGILAAISIVSYNGYQERARAAAAIAGVNQATDLLEAYQLKNGGLYPSTLAAAGVTNNNSVEYQYTQVSGGTNYCVTATSKNVSYKMSQDTKPTSGGCAGHGANGVPAITNYALNPNADGATTAAFGYAGSPAAATRSIASDRSHDGTTSLKTVLTATGQTGAQARVPANAMRVNVGERISWSFWVYSTKAGSLIPYIDATKVSDATYTGGSSTTVVIPANTWTKVTGQFTPTLDMYVTQIGGYNLAVVAGDTVWFDSFMVEKSTTLHNFADGSSSNWVWNGTANNATSTGPPL